MAQGTVHKISLQLFTDFGQSPLNVGKPKYLSLLAPQKLYSKAIKYGFFRKLFL